MERTHAFYEKTWWYDNFMARFVPIIRTFSPFVAGVSEMPYGYFLTWDVIGGATWVATFTLLATSSAIFPLFRIILNWSSSPLFSSRLSRRWCKELKLEKK